MDPANGSLQDIFDKGAVALEGFFWPGKAVHVAVDWQRMYCDPAFADDPQNAQRRAERVTPVQDDMNRMVADLRGVLPTIWVYHAIPHYPTPLQSLILKSLSADDAARKLQEFQQQAHELTGAVDFGRDTLLAKQNRSAFAGTELDQMLKQVKIDTLLVSGLYRSLRECVGKTVEDAQALGYNVFVVEDLTVDKVDHTDRSRYSLCWTTAIRDGAHCVTSDQVRRVAAKFQP